MARYKSYSYDQSKLIPVSFAQQILPGSFEYALNYVVDHELDLSVFAARYKNDATGRLAYDPALLLKIVLYAYSKGIIHSRKIEAACRTNIVFMALSADTQPHFTTIADFIARMSGEIVPLFRDVLLYCDQLGLIGKQMFAIDGCKLPGNASKEWSGTKAELLHKQKKMETAVERMLAAHRTRDAQDTNATLEQREQQYIETMKKSIRKIKTFLDTHDDKPGKTGKPRKSNITDNDSAKMKTSHGVLQGYDGVAAVDDKHQVIVHAQAYGQPQEHDLLQPMIEGTQEHFAAIGTHANIFTTATVTADSGFHSEANMKMLADKNIDAVVADNQFRKRDPRFAEADKYKERHRKELRHGKLRHFTPHDFSYDPQQQTCVCPAGKSLYRNGSNVVINGYAAVKFCAPKSACGPCPLRTQCLKHPERTPVRQVCFFSGATPGKPETFTARMKRKIDSTLGRALYSRRIATVEPVFANIRSTLRMDRFTLRGKHKVNAQWMLYCIVHNLTKIHRFGLHPA